MLSALLPALLVVLVLTAPIVIAAEASARMYMGQWHPQRRYADRVWFDSDLGRFGFVHDNVFTIQHQQHPERRIPIAQVTALRFTYQRLHSLEALAAVGLDPWLNRKWPRQLDRYEVTLVTTEGDVPVFVAGQVFVAPPMVGWLVERAVDWLDDLGYAPDAETHARAVVDDLQAEFARRGHPVNVA